MITLYIKNAQVFIPSTVTPNTAAPDKPYQKVRVLPFGSDDFLSVNCSAPVAVGHYDMQVNYISGTKNGKAWHFFDLLQIIPVK